jgi:formylglycine-generating enzyme
VCVKHGRNEVGVVVGRCLAFPLVVLATVGVLHACEVEEVASAEAAERASEVPPAKTPDSADDAPGPVALAPPLSEDSPCPDGMILVDGMYCPRVKQVCKRWIDPVTSPYAFYRCAEYEPSVCESAEREHKRFCIDREEHVRPGDSLPLANQSWTSASRVCAGDGKRLCLESEWQLACEGEEMRPYPYGFSRDATACNIDQPHLGKPQSGLTDLRAPVDAYPQCLSPFGVHDMSGNVEEWTTLDHSQAPERSAMKGAWWLPGKNNCRAVTLGHGEVYEGPQVGVRCCRDAGADAD